MRKIVVGYEITHPAFGNFKTLNKTVEVADDATMKDLDAMIDERLEQIRREITIRVAGRRFED